MIKNDDYLRALQESDLSMRAGNIDSRNFFLIHGTADTIVHQQHSLMLARALIDQGVGFRHQVEKSIVWNYICRKRYLMMNNFSGIH